MPNVILINVKGLKPNTPGIVYLGRQSGGWKGSALANPYHIGPQCTRVQSIALYRKWLWKVINEKNSTAWVELKRLVDSKEDVTLGCWCLPQHCHIQVVKAAIEWLRLQ